MSLSALRERFRRQMPVAAKWAYFDHAAVAPLSGPAAAVLHEWTRQACEEGDTVWGEWAGRLEEIRRRAASLVNAESEEICFIPNTTAGITLVAEGFPWRAGDNVVIAANEYPANQYPWLNLESRGVEIRRVPPEGSRIDPQHIAAACDARTRIVSLSWVGYGRGWRIDPRQFAEVAHAHGALFFLDAIQGLGVFPLDVRASGVDFFAADGHKWLLGPEGAGLFYIRREHLDLLRAIGVGAGSVVHRHDYGHIELKLRGVAARFEGGSSNIMGILAMGASLDLLAELGLSPTASPIADAVLDITRHAMEKLEAAGATIASPREDAHRSGIVSFEIPGANPQALRTHCLKSGVALACRDGRLRISPHAYNHEDDVARLIAALHSM